MNVAVNIYDLNGKLVQTLFNGVRETGRYEIQFNASMLSSGVYFYRIEADGFTDTKKLILLK